ncbi:MAG: serine/threonine-protein kinase [Pirellulales bacterium]
MKFAYPSGSRPLEGYTIKRGIGRGGFGEVYYATSDGGKEVALKLIRRNLEVELRGVSHCLNLKHPNLLTLYDIKTDDQQDSWVVMEYVSGDCLEDVIARSPHGMPVEHVLAWMQGIAAGVAYLHDHGIVHRDLKPGNIFSDEDVVKIGDYGLSKFISCSRRSGQTESVGTVHYMAPEVANGRYGKEIDVYALGIILYEMLTGHVPFEGESVGEVLMKHLTAEPDLSAIQEPYRTVIAKALDKDPERRLKSVAEFMAQLPKPAGSHAAATPLPPRPETPRRDAHQPPPIPVAELVDEDEEPVLRAVRQGWTQLRADWDRANLNTPTKIIIFLAVGFLVLTNFPLVIGLAVAVAVAYGVYRVVRAIVIGSADSKPGHVHRAVPRPAMPAGPPRTPTPPRPAPVVAPVSRYMAPPPRRSARREKAVPAMLVKPPRERLTELTGSLLASSAVAVVMCVVMAVFSSFQGQTPQAEQCVMLGLVGVVGSWAVLIPAKFWEGTQGDAIWRRFVLLVGGLVVGTFAFALASALLVDLPLSALTPPHMRSHLHFPVHGVYNRSSFFAADGTPLMPAYMAGFGVLFVLLRWWRQADPLRASRFSFWASLVSVGWAWVIAAILEFPDPWTVWFTMVAATVSVSVQLASPWLHPRDRIARQVA